ncbi:TPA: ead/Ea22-like family protein [Klebsiella pneumoniae]|nr:ead/Ea22-like family protein [Klebsiella pneumoniae]EKV8924196.1 ead/Ea22-like family protein [Klebsiella pneumoniae]ELA0718795.1 ead/Ea22-like family protein [Klebsiella pneumoniae]STU69529.1 RelE family toxin-antitoxin system [Klebsiella pneumoniae]STV07730.1 RelE family toxin-antitoxin system [Klebsiella pneumoniae]
MTDITELAQRMKAAAEKATPGPWYVHDKPCEDGNYGIDTSDKEFLAEAVVWWGFARQSIWREEDAKYIALANPANILALVEALEKAQTKADVYDMLRDDYGLREKGVGLADLVDWQAKRIAELESRTVKLPDLRQIVSGDRYVWSDGVYNYSQDVKVALAAAGIKVEIE